MEQLFAGAQKLRLAHTGRYMSSFYNGNELYETIHYNAPKAIVTVKLREKQTSCTGKRGGKIAGQQLHHGLEFLSSLSREKQRMILERLYTVIRLAG
jgi:hypothetical protein